MRSPWSRKASRHVGSAVGPAPDQTAVCLSLFMALVLAGLTVLVDARHVAPALALVTIPAGLVLGALALCSRCHGRDEAGRLLDAAGIVVLFGFASAIVCDKTDALAFISVLLGGGDGMLR